MEGEYCKIWRQRMLHSQSASCSWSVMLSWRSGGRIRRRGKGIQGCRRVQQLRDEVDEIMGKEESATLRAEHLYRDLNRLRK